MSNVVHTLSIVPAAELEKIAADVVPTFTLPSVGKMMVVKDLIDKYGDDYVV